METGSGIISILLLLSFAHSAVAAGNASASSAALAANASASSAALAANAAAPSPPNIDLQALVQPLRLDDDSFSASAAPISRGRWAYLIYINATQAAMVVAEQKDDGAYSAKLLTQEYEIRPVLKAYYAAQGYDGLARKELLAAHQIVQQTDAKEVKDCRQMMGISSHACNGYDACFSACRTSPTCSQLAEGVGRSFVYQLWDYQNRSQVMADALAGEEKQYGTTDADISLLTISKYKSSLSAVWAARDGLLSHPYNKWVCKRPFYDSAAPDNVGRHLALAEKRIIAMQGDDDGAKKIAAEAARRMALKEKEGGLLAVNAIFGAGAGNLLIFIAIGLGAVLLAGVDLVVARIRRKKTGKKETVPKKETGPKTP